MQVGKWTSQLLLAAACLVLGLLLAVQLRAERAANEAARSEDWEFVVADLVDSNARLREQTGALEAQLAGLQDAGSGAAVLQSLVDEVNQLRIENGQVEVSGPGVEVFITGPISVLDLHDLINELRNAGAEALALNEERLVAWSAISTNGEQVTVDGRPVQSPYRLRAIGDSHTLEVALNRPGGLVDLLQKANRDVSISVEAVEKLTLPVYQQPFEFAYGRPVK
jgi:uncharacterized protein YlxW (UPF0749 family)